MRNHSIPLMLPVAAGSCPWVGTGVELPSAPTAAGAAAITYQAQHWAGNASSQGQILLLKFISCLLKMQRNSLLPFEYLPLARMLHRFGTPRQLSPKPQTLSLRPNPWQSWQRCSSPGRINGPCTLLRWWQGQINPLLQNQCSDGSWWVTECPLSLRCPENGHVAHGPPNICAETEIT